MIAAQIPSERKRERAHDVIENDSTREELAARVDALWRELEAAARDA
jgi:dephospho-CoA kinase